jgi:translation initiation factor 5B
MRAPICCILGHVDVGKTHLLDYLRHSQISKGEAGGITQQIGATCFSQDAILQFTHWFKTPINIPSLLLVDTPGHDCFSQMRQIGMKVSDLAVIVVDIFKGLEKQTLQCLELLQERKLPYIIAINKIDRIHKWTQKRAEPNKTQSDLGTPLKVSLAEQSSEVTSLFRKSIFNIQKQLGDLNIDAQLYYENTTPDDTISMVPISAITGEGIPDLIMLIAKITDRNFRKHQVATDLVMGSIIDHKKDAKLGMLYHSILINGKLTRQMPIIIKSADGQLKEMTIQDIYVPNDDTELKHKNKYQSVDEVIGSKGIALKFITESETDIDVELGCEFYLKNQTQPQTESISQQGGRIGELETDPISAHGLKKYLLQEMNDHSKKDVGQIQVNPNLAGVTINLHAQSMVDALSQLLIAEKVPVREVNIGEINKVLIIKTASANLAPKGSVEWEYNQRSTVILNYNPNLAPDTKLDPILVEFAKQNNVTIFSSAIIYHLLEQYQSYVKQRNVKLQAKYPNISSPLKLKILPEFIFKKKGQFLFGVKVLQNQLMLNQLIEAQLKDPQTGELKTVVLGKVIGMQKADKASKDVTLAKLDEEICIKIQSLDPQLEYDKQFSEKWELTNSLSAEEMMLKVKYPDVFLTK